MEGKLQFSSSPSPLVYYILQTGWAVAPPELLKPMHISLTQVYYTHVSLIQEAIAVGLETELARFGEPDSYLVQTVQTLMRKRDEVCGVLSEVGMTPIVPDGGYFVLADVSAIGKEFDTGPGKEAYDFQFAKWMMVEKVTQRHPFLSSQPSPPLRALQQSLHRRFMDQNTPTFPENFSDSAFARFLEHSQPHT